MSAFGRGRARSARLCGTRQRKSNTRSRGHIHSGKHLRSMPVHGINAYKQPVCNFGVRVIFGYQQRDYARSRYASDLPFALPNQKFK